MDKGLARARSRQSLGVKAIIYTTTPFWKTFLGNSTWFADNGYRLWIAHWTSAAQPTLPASNWGGHSWTLWQYTNAGIVDGIDGNVDQDRFRGLELRSAEDQEQPLIAAGASSRGS